MSKRQYIHTKQSARMGPSVKSKDVWKGNPMTMPHSKFIDTVVNPQKNKILIRDLSPFLYFKDELRQYENLIGNCDNFNDISTEIFDIKRMYDYFVLNDSLVLNNSLTMCQIYVNVQNILSIFMYDKIWYSESYVFTITESYYYAESFCYSENCIMQIIFSLGYLPLEAEKYENFITFINEEFNEFFKKYYNIQILCDYSTERITNTGSQITIYIYENNERCNNLLVSYKNK